jgi:hypothetical protein
MGRLGAWAARALWGGEAPFGGDAGFARHHGVNQAASQESSPPPERPTSFTPEAPRRHAGTPACLAVKISFGLLFLGRGCDQVGCSRWLGGAWYTEGDGASGGTLSAREALGGDGAACGFRIKQTWRALVRSTPSGSLGRSGSKYLFSCSTIQADSQPFSNPSACRRCRRSIAAAR